MRQSALILLCFRAWAGRCENLEQTSLPGVSIDHARMVISGTFTPPNGAPLTNLPPFCRVALTARPSKDSDIKIEVWLPEREWNGKLEGTGNGGFAGRIAYGALANGLKLGFATTNTDMGMSTPPGRDASVFIGRAERWKDWGYRATHEMTIAAKSIVNAYYGKPPGRSYFTGCSTGGEQALMEAQKFPADYDGIVAGAPAHNRTGVHMSILWNFEVTEKDPAAYIPPAKLPHLAAAVVALCGDSQGVVADPPTCSFDPASMQCKGADATTCLTASQVGAVRDLYQGPRNPRTRKQIYPGLPKGSEFAWDRLGAAPATAPQPPFGPIFQWVFGPAWDWRSFDFDQSTKTFESKLEGTLNATSNKLDEFRKRGGKLLLYHGWADWLVPPGETIAYYNSLPSRVQGETVRLFLLPGVAHCSGGPGADQFDGMTAVVKWVENHEPPGKLDTAKVVDGNVKFRRSVLPFSSGAK